MKMSYFDDTNTLYIELKNTDVADTKDLELVFHQKTSRLTLR